jgi:hypothetical protein
MSARRALRLALLVPVAMAELHLQAADGPALPGAGFTGDRYAPLWTKSPFAIATPDAPAVSTDYQLVGIAQFDGISYASLIDKQTQEHFVVSSDKPFKNISLVSISPGKGGSATTAVVQRNGEPLTLTLDTTPVAAANGETPGVPPPMNPMNMPQNGSVGGVIYPSAVGGGAPPRVHIHRPPIRFPPPPAQ